MTVVGRATSVTPAGMVASQPGAMADRSSRTALLAAVAAAGLLTSVLAGCAGIATPPPSAAGSPSGTASGDPASPSASTAGSPTLAPSPSAVPSPTPVAYVVATGDTLFSIARRFDTTARSIAYWNRVTYPNLDPESTDYEPDQIRIGWTLTVWPGQEVDEASPPPGPSPTPQPSVVIGPAITPRPDGTSLLVDHGSRDGNAVALTFDLGGRTESAVAIVRWLIEHDVPATIFPTGETGTTTADGREALTLVAAHPDLFTIGNHTWDHPDLTELDGPAVTTELDRTETAVEALVGRSTKPFFRPPFGAQDRRCPHRGRCRRLAVHGDVGHRQP